MFELRKLKPFKPEVYENIDLNRLTVYAIWMLQENKIPVTFENIVVTLYRMFPKKFSLFGFQEYPDAARINRALLQLRPKYRNWAVGDVTRGFILTEIGKGVVKQTEELLKNPQKQRTKIKIPKGGKERTKQEKDIKEIETSDIYKKYTSNDLESITNYDFWNLLHAMSYTPPKALRKYMNDLKESAKSLERNELLEFLNWIEKKYNRFFRERIK